MGYIRFGDSFITPVTVVGAEPTGNIILSDNGTFNVKNYASATVDVHAVNNTPLTVTPTTSEQELTPESPYTGFGTVTVNAVTSAIDSNIVASNIKSGITILGVQGNVTQLKGTTLTATTNGTYTPGSSYNGYTSVTVNVGTETLTAYPSVSSQSFSPTSPNIGFSSVTLNPVSLNVDGNLLAKNIKQGVTLFGITGTYTGMNDLTISLTGDNPSNLDTLEINGTTYTYSDFTNDELTVTLEEDSTVSYAITTTDSVTESGSFTLIKDCTLSVDLSEVEGTTVVTVTKPLQRNYNVVGTLTDNNGVISGFDNNNYITIPNFRPGNNTWEQHWKITTGSLSSKSIVGCGDIDYSRPVIGIYSILAWTKKFRIYLSSNGTSWDLANNSQGGTFAANTTYYLVLKWDGSKYYLDYSTDGETYTNAITITSSTPIFDSPCVTRVGRSTATDDAFNGSIDMNECYIVINNNVVWKGIE